MRMNPPHVKGDGANMAIAVLSPDDVNEVEGGEALGEVAGKFALAALLLRRPAQNLLQLLLLVPGQLRSILVARVTGYHRVQPGASPSRQPLPHGSSSSGTNISTPSIIALIL